MKVLNLIQCANLGGMEQASLRLMQGLQAKGHELELLSLNRIGALGPLLHAAKIPYEGLPYAGKGGWRILRQLRRELRQSGADALLMTGHHLLGSLALGDVCRGRRVLSIHYHHRGDAKSDWQWRVIYKVACSRFQAITFPSDFIRQEAENIHPPVARLAHTIRIPLNIQELPTEDQKQAARRILGLPLTGPIIGNAGWLIPRKRFDVFLRTAAIVSSQFPEAHFVIAGDGEERQRLQALAASLKLTHRLTWTGWLQNMEIFYRSLDVLLFNSDWDAMGLTPLEAMSHGIPVVTSVLNGGLKEILSLPQWGFLVDRHEPEELTSAVAHLLENPMAARQISLAGRERVHLISDPEAIADQYEKLLLR